MPLPQVITIKRTIYDGIAEGRDGNSSQTYNHNSNINNAVIVRRRAKKTIRS